MIINTLYGKYTITLNSSVANDITSEEQLIALLKSKIAEYTGQSGWKQYQEALQAKFDDRDFIYLARIWNLIRSSRVVKK